MAVPKEDNLQANWSSMTMSATCKHKGSAFKDLWAPIFELAAADRSDRRKQDVYI